jgi:NAD(P)H-dependent FMN reductase
MTMITIISGTNRTGSNSLKLARHLAELHREAGKEVTVLDLAELPVSIFTPSVYAEKPAEFTEKFVRPVLEAEGLHVVVPEYNGSFPGVLKYFIDLLPFPEAFEARPTAYVGLAAGMFGALRAVEQLQLVFGYRNALNYPRRVFLPAVYKAFDGDGALQDAEIKERLAAQVTGFGEYIRRVRD